ncbi:hypothetical protein GCM10022221_69300 [Actinocorallia aurea]
MEGVFFRAAVPAGTRAGRLSAADTRLLPNEVRGIGRLTEPGRAIGEPRDDRSGDPRYVK